MRAMIQPNFMTITATQSRRQGAFGGAMEPVEYTQAHSLQYFALFTCSKGNANFREFKSMLRPSKTQNCCRIKIIFTNTIGSLHLWCMDRSGPCTLGAQALQVTFMQVYKYSLKSCCNACIIYSTWQKSVPIHFVFCFRFLLTLGVCLNPDQEPLRELDDLVITLNTC